MLNILAGEGIEPSWSLQPEPYESPELPLLYPANLFRSKIMIELECPVCLKKFERSLTQYNQNLKRKRSNCCSLKCASILAREKLGYHESITTECCECHKIINRTYSQFIQSKNHFCSQSCSGSYNNRIRNLDKPKKVKPIIKKELINSTTYYATNYTKDYLFSNSKNWQSARTTIRKHAALVFKESNRERRCSFCGYDKTIEIAHIKSVSSFSKDSLIKDINAIDNIIALCPNHHWEYDHGLINLT